MDFKTLAILIATVILAGIGGWLMGATQVYKRWNRELNEEKARKLRALRESLHKMIREEKQ